METAAPKRRVNCDKRDPVGLLPCAMGRVGTQRRIMDKVGPLPCAMDRVRPLSRVMDRVGPLPCAMSRVRLLPFAMGRVGPLPRDMDRAPSFLTHYKADSSSAAQESSALYGTLGSIAMFRKDPQLFRVLRQKNSGHTARQYCRRQKNSGHTVRQYCRRTQLCTNLPCVRSCTQQRLTCHFYD